MSMWGISFGFLFIIQGAFFILFFPSNDVTKPTTLDFYLLKYGYCYGQDAKIYCCAKSFYNL